MLQRELLEFLKETADAAFCVNRQGELCSWNSAAEELFGYPASEAIGKPTHGLLRCRGSLDTKLCTHEFYAQHATAKHCRIPNFDMEVTVRSGRRIWVDLSTLVFKDSRTHFRLILHLSRLGVVGDFELEIAGRIEGDVIRGTGSLPKEKQAVGIALKLTKRADLPL